MIKSRNSQFTAEYRYDALGRRIQKRSKHHHTGDEHNIIYGWDGDTLAYESTEEATKHYIYEKDSFVPMLQAVYQSPIELHQTPDWSDKPYSLQRDPLWKTSKKAKDWNDVWFYHCDHLGTPQEMTDHTGAVIWKANYLVWGECKPEKTKSNFFEDSEIISNNIRFQGQYFDLETGLHYNRYRYYSPYVGRFISKDPIGLFGGYNVYAYAPNPVSWIDPLGLKSECDCLKKGDPNGTGNYRGGSYGGTTKPGIESHHMPANSVTSLAKSQGPAIQMDPDDHSETSSHGHKGNAGKTYRADVKALIDAGDMRGAMAKEIKDVRRVAALSGDRTKYNTAIQEMLAYAKCIKMLDK